MCTIAVEILMRWDLSLRFSKELKIRLFFLETDTITVVKAYFVCCFYVIFLDPTAIEESC